MSKNFFSSTKKKITTTCSNILGKSKGWDFLFFGKFDNTIVNYDDVFSSEVRNRGWSKENSLTNKEDVRDAVRALDDGENKWRIGLE